MEIINLNNLKLTNEESKDIIKFIAKKRGTTTKIILKTINQDQKRRINKTQQKLIKTQQKLTKTHQKLIKSQKSQEKLIKSQEKRIKSQKSQQKLIISQQKLIKSQQVSSKKRMETIRKKLNELHHNFPKSELKEIKKYLYNLENKNRLSETSKKYLDELDKKILKLNKYDDFIGIENIRDLFSILNYEPILVKTGFNNNYLEYRSEGNN